MKLIRSMTITPQAAMRPKEGREALLTRGLAFDRRTAFEFERAGGLPARSNLPFTFGQQP